MAEKYPNYGGYVYTLNNPINFIAPDGREVVPYYVASLDRSGKAVYQRGLGTKNFDGAMRDFIGTSFGNNFISQFANKGQKVFGYTATSDGKYSNHTLNVNLKEPSERGAFMTAEGSFTVTENKKGSLDFTVYVNDNGMGKNALGEIIAHEMALHGDGFTWR